MNKNKTLLLTALALIATGIVIFVVVMAVNGWDFYKLETSGFETNVYEISEEFSDICINTNTADITFVLSKDEKCVVECFEQSSQKHSVKVIFDELHISTVNEKELIDYIGISFRTPKIKVFLPKKEYSLLFIRERTGDIKIPKDFKFDNVDVSASTGDVDFYASATDKVKIRLSTGDVNIEDSTASVFDLTASTGKTTLNNVKCENITTVANTGDLFLKNAVAKESFFIKRTTGDVTLEKCDADEIDIKTDTGDVTGTLLSEKTFVVSTDTGNINVPDGTAEGKCEITTTTGDVKIKVTEKNSK